MAKINFFLVFKYCLAHVQIIKMIKNFFVSLTLAIKPVSFLASLKMKKILPVWAWFTCDVQEGQEVLS